jgi:hypothetical protein
MFPRALDYATSEDRTKRRRIVQTFYSEIEAEAVAKAEQRERDINTLNYFLNERRARTRNEALAAWARIVKLIP